MYSQMEKARVEQDTKGVMRIDGVKPLLRELVIQLVLVLKARGKNCMSTGRYSVDWLILVGE